MENYSWEQSGSYEAPQGDGFGWAILVAVMLALLLHLAFFIWGVGKFIEVEIAEAEEWVSEPIRLSANDIEIEPVSEAPPEEEIERPQDDADLIASADEVLPDLLNADIDVSPIAEPALPDLRIEKPRLDGSEEGDLIKASIGPQTKTDRPEPGQIDYLFPEAKMGQIVVDKGKPLSDVFDPNTLAKDFGRKKGADGNHAKGVIDGYTGLAAYAKMSPGDLQRNKASIGSDLLFEFGSATLRDDARLTLMTVAMLIDRNPDMYCWVEGHTDLIGSDASNRILSRRRGDAVKNWLVQALRISPARIIVRAFGEDQPVILEGSVEEQAPNRRVDIKMRKARPEPVKPVAKETPITPPKQVEIPPKKAEVIPTAVLIDESEKEEAPKTPEIPKAEPVEEEVPKAEIIEPEIPRAIPVEEDTGSER